MKTPLLLLVCVVMLYSLPDSSSGQQSIRKGICCFGKGSNRRIKLNRLNSYYWTSNFCTLKRLVFVTTTKRNICMNPENEWVQKIIKEKLILDLSI
uniref:C-C motif chemokine 5-like n=1 Tax=Danio rerio TaxID=7955 RepID=A0A8M3AZJ3_DANRE|nr:C-C motif chemokine 5-like [Danio rerio]XP_021329504.1 C-C motif chemokine 5-like [Danio rerio]|eukprot:XP_009296138.1 C-C motif chemokine 5-like [Danio rerio]